MAEKFGDEECKKKLMQAPNVQTAEEAVKNIQKFDSKVWDEVFVYFHYKNRILILGSQKFWFLEIRIPMFNTRTLFLYFSFLKFKT